MFERRLYYHVDWALVATVFALAALGLMVTLPSDTWIRLGVWLAIGLAIFFLYARRHTAERFRALAAGERALESDDS